MRVLLFTIALVASSFASTINGKAFSDPIAVATMEEMANAEKHEDVDKNVDNTNEDKQELNWDVIPTSDYGQICIPSLGISFALTAENNTQEAVNNYDTGVIELTGCKMIEEHQEQNNFSYIRSAIPGETQMYIKRADGTIETYVCAEYHDGRGDMGWTYYDIVDNCFVADDIRFPISTITCNGWPYVSIVYWAQI